MQKKQRHEYCADTAIAKLAVISSKIDIAIGALNFAISWDDGDTIFLAYIRDTLQDTKLNHQAILENVSRLAELADPNSQAELPF